MRLRCDDKARRGSLGGSYLYHFCAQAHSSIRRSPRQSTARLAKLVALNRILMHNEKEGMPVMHTRNKNTQGSQPSHVVEALLTCSLFAVRCRTSRSLWPSAIIRCVHIMEYHITDALSLLMTDDGQSERDVRQRTATTTVQQLHNMRWLRACVFLFLVMQLLAFPLFRCA